MKLDERHRAMAKWHRAMMERIEKMHGLPPGVDEKRLEEAYDKIESEYVFVLKRK